jgi:hypothetical protein
MRPPGSSLFVWATLFARATVSGTLCCGGVPRSVVAVGRLLASGEGSKRLERQRQEGNGTER